MYRKKWSLNFGYTQIIFKLESFKWPEVKQKQYKWQGYKHWFGHETQNKEKQYHKISDQYLLLNIAQISQYSKKQEKSAEHIFSFCHLCYGFHMKRMQGK